MDSDDGYSGQFKVDKSENYPVHPRATEERGHFFNKETEIIKHGDRIRGIYGNMEE